LRCKKVLCHDDVFSAVAVKVRNAHSERGRKLRFDGQAFRLEMVAAIKEERMLERIRLSVLALLSLSP
jgi:hypothetical protein